MQAIVLPCGFWPPNWTSWLPIAPLWHFEYSLRTLTPIQAFTLILILISSSWHWYWHWCYPGNPPLSSNGSVMRGVTTEESHFQPPLIPRTYDTLLEIPNRLFPDVPISCVYVTISRYDERPTFGIPGNIRAQYSSPTDRWSIIDDSHS